MTHRILLVDDDTASRIGLIELLSESGYEVTGVNTLTDAMQAMSDNPPHLLITDIRLRGYNGLQLVALSPDPIPAIVITGFPDRTIEAEARKLGAEYLQKPVSPPELLALVRQLLGEAAGAPAGTRARRWQRKAVTSSLPARVADVPAQVVDISYGGLRLEVGAAGGAYLPPSFSVVLPASGVAVDVNVVWQKRESDDRWHYGAAVSTATLPVWRQVVDAI